MFIAYLKQKNVACDCSIACGEELLELKAKTQAEAIEELKLIVIGEFDTEDNLFDGDYWDEYAIDEMKLYETISCENIPIKKWYMAAEKLQNKQAKKAIEDAERIEYERLKSKYANKNHLKGRV